MGLTLLTYVQIILIEVSSIIEHVYSVVVAGFDTVIKIVWGLVKVYNRTCPNLNAASLAVASVIAIKSLVRTRAYLPASNCDIVKWPTCWLNVKC